MEFFRATIEILIRADGESEACDGMSSLLTETGIYNNNLIADWAYSHGPVEVDVPDDEQGHEEYFADGDLKKGLPVDLSKKAEIERDEARAQVAAAFEAAANASMESGPSYFMTQTGGGFQETHTKLGAFAFRTDIRDAIRALTPNDAKAALESYGREKVREGMQHMLNRLQHEGQINPSLTYADAIEWAEYALADMEKLK